MTTPEKDISMYLAVEEIISTILLSTKIQRPKNLGFLFPLAHGPVEVMVTSTVLTTGDTGSIPVRSTKWPGTKQIHFLEVDLFLRSLLTERNF